MRLCTIATGEFELLFTTVGLEPLLAEAATQAMAASEISPIELLSTYMDINCISVGERGELVAALLVMRAHDVLYWQSRLVKDGCGSSTLWKSWLRIQNCGQLCQNVRVQARPNCNSKKRSRNPAFG